MKFRVLPKQCYIKETGISQIIYVDDEFFPTIVDGTTLPTKDLYDLIIINPSEFVVGYQRAETVSSFLGAKPSRDYYIEAEVWFCFMCVPMRKNVAGTIKTYKHMARLKDITTA